MWMNLLQFVKVLCLKSVAMASHAWILFTTLGTCTNHSLVTEHIAHDEKLVT